MSRLDEIRERLDEATPGPWHGSLSRDGTGSVWEKSARQIALDMSA